MLIAQQLPRAAWPAGTQAVIAELAASEYDVRVQLSRAREQSALLLELAREAGAPDTAAAVVVLRDGTSGVALVSTPNSEQPLELTGDADSGAVGEGALALRVRELIHARDLPIPAPEAKAAPAPAPRPTPVKRPVPPRSPPPPRPAAGQLWLGGGALLATGVDTPALLIALGARFALGQRFALEPKLALTALPMRRELTAGQLTIDGRELTLHLSLDAFRRPAVTLTMGAGGGALWLAQSGRASDGYRTEHHQLIVGTLSLLARASLHAGPISFALTLSPGVWLRALSVRVDENEVSKIGRVQGSALLSAGFDWR